MENPANKSWFASIKESDLKGPGGNTDFTDIDKISEFKSQKDIPYMKQFKILTEGNYVFGVEVVYRGGPNNEGISAGQHISRQPENNMSGFEWRTFDFHEEEFITEMSVRTGAWMDRIAFKTNKGRNYSVGGGGGDFYDLGLKEGKNKMPRVVAIGGGYGDQMKNLKAYYVKVPKTQKQAAAAVSQSERGS